MYGHLANMYSGWNAQSKPFFLCFTGADGWRVTASRLSAVVTRPRVQKSAEPIKVCIVLKIEGDAKLGHLFASKVCMIVVMSDVTDLLLLFQRDNALIAIECTATT